MNGTPQANILVSNNFTKFSGPCVNRLPFFRHFARCERRPEWLRSWQTGGTVAVFESRIRDEIYGNRTKMDDSVQKSCWGVTAKAVIGFAGIILLAWLFGGPASAAILVVG